MISSGRCTTLWGSHAPLVFGLLFTFEVSARLDSTVQGREVSCEKCASTTGTVAGRDWNAPTLSTAVAVEVSQRYGTCDWSGAGPPSQYGACACVAEGRGNTLCSRV